ncbi:MAG: hypothetical protein PHP42_01585 [Bacteroidota bacterium]|nr:hypothetical protein [Bacteroidota bacterium]
MPIKISLPDHSQYFKGLLLLIRKDRIVHDQEKQLMLRIGKIMGFEKEFCENSINEILENEYIVDEYPQFSNQEIAKCFIKDGLHLAMVDNNLDDSELEWLSTTAELHGISAAWFNTELTSRKKLSNVSAVTLEAEQFQI